MNRNFMGILCAGVFAFSASALVQGANEIELGSKTGVPGQVVSIPLTLTSTDEVQGLVAAFEWDAALGASDTLVPGAALASADLVVTRAESDYMVIGVVVDSNGEGAAFLPPGTDTLIATAKIRISATIETEVSTALRFVDSKYASVAGGPLLENLVTVGGLSITAQEGLTLTGGTLVAKPGEKRFTFKIESKTAEASSGCGNVRVLLDATAAVEGYEVAVAHPAGLALESVAAGSAAVTNGADFTSSQVLPAGGVIGVVLDLAEPFLGNTIPPGDGLEIAVYSYCCASATPGEKALTFVDGQLGSPPKDNTVVSGGLSYAPELVGGSFTCISGGGEEECADGQDNDGDTLVDCADPDCQDAENCKTTAFTCGGPTLGASDLPPAAVGPGGGVAELCFYYKAPGETGADPIQIQGLSMAICYPCDLTAKEGTFDITGTIVESVGAEYVNHHADNDPADGDACELIIGILVDAAPPFDGATLPPTDTYLKIGCIDMEVAANSALCGKCLPISFCDGADGRGKVPVRNLISVDNQSRSPLLVSCDVCVGGDKPFHRGDCNYSNVGSFSVDIADAAAAVSYLFYSGDKKYEAPCLDACDSNDDGRVDLADVLHILKFLFQFGPFPPAPGPGFDEAGGDVPPGSDPTPDELTCGVGSSCP